MPSKSAVGADGPLIHKDGKACVYKLHHFSRRHIKVDRGDKAIVILRNPLDAFVSNLRYKEIWRMDDTFIDKMWSNYEVVLRGFHGFIGEKTLIYYEDLLDDFEKAITPALELMELEVDSNKIKTFMDANVENYKTVNRWFKQHVKKKRLSDNMNFTDRRNSLSERHTNMIKNKIQESPYKDILERYL